MKNCFRVILTFAFSIPCWSQLNNADIESNDISSREPEYVESVQCPEPGSFIARVRSTYTPATENSGPSRDWKFGCRKFSQIADEMCATVSPARQGHIFWDVQCPEPNGYLRGIERLAVSPGIDYFYRFNCCRALVPGPAVKKDFEPMKEKRIVPLTCYTHTFIGAGGDAYLALDFDEVITGIRTVYFAGKQDRGWQFTICSFEDQLQIRTDAYIYFPSNSSDLFHDGLRASPDYRYSSTCEEGTIATRIDSIWGHKNKDRGFRLTCTRPDVISEKARCRTIKARIPEGLVNDVTEPRDWVSEGCRGQEALVGITSTVVDDVRRYRFDCCELIEPHINDTGCVWERVTDETTADWALEPPSSHVIRGISSQYSKQQNDRINIYLEVCPLSTEEIVPLTPPRCSYAMTKPVPKQVQQASFMQMKGLTMFECARRCDQYPFCLTFRYSGAGTCIFSYAKNLHDCPKKLPDLVPQLNPKDEVWVYCFNCDSFEEVKKRKKML